MNILLVDDEKLAVEVLQKTIDMVRYGIDEVYVAYSMKQAVELLESHSISIMVCDIEMPKGSGLDLAEWIREQGLEVMTIFLTSHALFRYAQTAIHLDAISYLLKPVKRKELEEAIEKAVEKIQVKIQTKKNEKYAGYWNSSKVALQREFWRKCLEEKSVGKGIANHIYGRAEKAGILNGEHIHYYPVLVEWSKKPGKSDFWNDDIMSFAIGNIFSEMLFQETEIGNVLTIEKNKCAIIYPVEKEIDVLVWEKCKLALEYCTTYLNCYNITVYVKGRARLKQIGKMMADMIRETEHDAVKKEGVVHLRKEKEVVSYEKLDTKQWVRGLFSGSYGETLKGMELHLEQLVRKGEIDTRILQCIQQDFLQDLYIEMGQHGIQANIIFSSDEMVISFMEAVKSVSGLMGWVQYLGEFLSHYNHGNYKMSAVIKEVKEYIEEHVGEEISRNELAAKVYLHPDYMNRLFKEQVGTSVSDYVIQMRLKHAKYLLRTTDASISAVAANVGYPNTAYFTKIFKRTTGVTPKEFRKMQEAG